MSLQDQLRGMLYSGNNTNFQNTSIYMEKDEDEVFSIPDFDKQWKEAIEKLVYALNEKLRYRFDYVMKSNNGLLFYLRPDGNKEPSKKISNDETINYKPEGQISVIPIYDKENNTVPKIMVQAKYDLNGENYNKRSINISTSNMDISELIDQIVKTSIALAKNLYIL